VDQTDRPWDASPLIGLVLAIPALLYLSFWYQRDADFLRHAVPAKAQVYRIERRKEGTYRGRQLYSYFTWVYFHNQAGQLTQGRLEGAHDWAQPSAEIAVYYLPGKPDVRFGGLRGIWGGLCLALGTVALGAALSFVAAWAARHRPRPSATASLEEVEALREDWDP
jgi:hypothetical protein